MERTPKRKAQKSVNNFSNWELFFPGEDLLNVPLNDIKAPHEIFNCFCGKYRHSQGFDFWGRGFILELRKFFPDKFPCGSLADIEKEKETAANFFKHSNPIPKLLSGPLGFSVVGIQVQQLISG